MLDQLKYFSLSFHHSIVPLTNEYNVAFRAFDIYIPELGIRDIQFLPSTDRSIRFSIIYEYHGHRHIKVYCLDVANRVVKEITPSFASYNVPDTSSCVIPGSIHLIVSCSFSCRGFCSL